jgi:hypothetical protein
VGRIPPEKRPKKVDFDIKTGRFRPFFGTNTPELAQKTPRLGPFSRLFASRFHSFTPPEKLGEEYKKPRNHPGAKRMIAGNIVICSAFIRLMQNLQEKSVKKNRQGSY